MNFASKDLQEYIVYTHPHTTVYEKYFILYIYASQYNHNIIRYNIFKTQTYVS